MMQMYHDQELWLFYWILLLFVNIDLKFYLRKDRMVFKLSWKFRPKYWSLARDISQKLSSFKIPAFLEKDICFSCKFQHRLSTIRPFFEQHFRSIFDNLIF
jgi:hypothetical protein